MPRPAGLPVVLLCLATGVAQAQEAPHADLLESTHIHGLAFDPLDKSRVLVATHSGFFAFDFETQEVAPVGESRLDFMSSSVSGGLFFASGHPETGGNSGVLLSTDGGVSWTFLSQGAEGPVDFHQMTASPAGPTILFGVFAGKLQRSWDAGATWELLGPVPYGLVDLAGSARNSDTLYAATDTGLLKSEDAGRTWAQIYPDAWPVSFVETGPDDTLYAFLQGRGLVRADEDSLNWTVVSEPLGGEYLTHFVTDGTRAVASTGSGMLLISETGGRDWAVLGD